MKSFLKSRLPFLFHPLRRLNLLKQAYFSKYGRIAGAINYPLSIVSQRDEIAARKRRAAALHLPPQLAGKLQELRTEGFCKLKLSDVVSGDEASAFIDS